VSALSGDQFGDRLSEGDKARLDFERETAGMGPGRKETEIWRRFNGSATVHFQRVNALLDNPHALAHDPVTVNRLRGLRDKRRSERQARTKGSDSTWGGTQGGR
jgi:hypothetical protein